MWLYHYVLCNKKIKNTICLLPLCRTLCSIILFLLFGFKEAEPFELQPKSLRDPRYIYILHTFILSDLKIRDYLALTFFWEIDNDKINHFWLRQWAKCHIFPPKRTIWSLGSMSGTERKRVKPCQDCSISVFSLLNL